MIELFRIGAASKVCYMVGGVLCCRYLEVGKTKQIAWTQMGRYGFVAAESFAINVSDL